MCNMSRVSFTLVAVLSLVVAAEDAHAADITICSQAATTYNINGTAAAATRAKLSNTANFGANGSFCDHNFSYVTVGNNFTQAAIDSAGCDIWWSGYEQNDSYTAAEETELQSWIDDGGQVIAGCDDTAHTPVCAFLGLTLDGTNVSNGNSEIQPVVDECFPNTPTDVPNGGGRVTTFNGSFGSVIISNQEQLGGPSVVFRDNIFASTDINMITRDSSCCLSDGSGVTNANDQFLADVMCTVADSVSGQANCFLCGNGELDPLEGCDDGNDTDGDGCDTFCRVEDGQTCNADPDGLVGDAGCASGVCDESANECIADTVVANDDSVDINEDNPAAIDVQDNDVNPGDTATTLTISDAPDNGVASVVNGVVNYVPSTDFFGQDTFEYTLCNAADPISCDTAAVTVNIAPLNDAPTATDDARRSTRTAAKARSMSSPTTSTPTTPISM